MSQLDKYGRHEVLHMSLFLAQAIESQLLDHAQIAANPRWRTLAETACDALQTLYQQIGAAHGEVLDAVNPDVVSR